MRTSITIVTRLTPLNIMVSLRLITVIWFFEQYNIQNGILTGDFVIEVPNREVFQLASGNGVNIYNINLDEDVASIVYRGMFTATKLDSINYVLNLSSDLHNNDIMRGYITLTVSQDDVDNCVFRKYFINDDGHKYGEDIIYTSITNITVNGNAVTCDMLAQDKIYCRYDDNKQVTSIIMYWIDGQLVIHDKYIKYCESIKQAINDAISPNSKIPLGDIVEQYYRQ